MPSSVALPSPPDGVPAVPEPHVSWLRRTLNVFVAREPTDLAGRLAVAATVLTGLPAIAAAIFGDAALPSQLFHLLTRLAWPLSAVVLAGGFMTRSRTARALAVITTTGLAALFAAERLGLPASAVAAGVWIYNASLLSTVALWTARTLRRRFDRETPEADGDH